MNSGKRKYTLIKFISGIFLMLALLWLTISIPFVYAGERELIEHNKMVDAGSPLTTDEEETTNPFSNSTEEKKSGNTSSFSEEYLHEHPDQDCFIIIPRQYHKCKNAGSYIAFHGELLVPPPNAA